jgi:hypothetical protein
MPSIYVNLNTNDEEILAGGALTHGVTDPRTGCWQQAF